MTEICLSCPIKSDDKDYPVLCAVADELADTRSPICDGWIYEHESIAPPEELYDDLISHELSSQVKTLPRGKVEKARKCAQLILWNQCEFRSLEND